MVTDQVKSMNVTKPIRVVCPQYSRYWVIVGLGTQRMTQLSGSRPRVYFRSLGHALRIWTDDDLVHAAFRASQNVNVRLGQWPRLFFSVGDWTVGKRCSLTWKCTSAFVFFCVQALTQKKAMDKWTSVAFSWYGARDALCIEMHPHRLVTAACWKH